MSVGTLSSVEEYLRTSFDPDRDFVDGELVERNVGKRKHALAQAEMAIWFGQRKAALKLQPITELRIRVRLEKFRIPDLVISEIPIPDEEVFTTPPYLCIEIMSPEDTMASLQDRIDDYHAFGVPNLWVIDPWKHRGYMVSPAAWTVALDGVMRTGDNRVAMPLSDVLLP